VTISIVIPAINEAAALSVLLPKLQQLDDVAEIIVVDGGSSDSTPVMTKQHGAVLLQSERGRALQMNTGAAHATGNTLFFLHADSQIPADASQLIQREISEGAQWGFFKLRLSGRHWLLRITERMINWRSCLTGIGTGDQGIFVQRELFESLEGYAPIPLMEDVALSKQLKSISHPACINKPIITSSRRWEHHGILRTILLMWRLRLAYALGTPPEKLAQRYRRSDNPGKDA
jgi:rSAM/selenodomain-associated transferase 2